MHRHDCFASHSLLFLDSQFPDLVSAIFDGIRELLKYKGSSEILLIYGLYYIAALRICLSFVSNIIIIRQGQLYTLLQPFSLSTSRWKLGLGN